MKYNLFYSPYIIEFITMCHMKSSPFVSVKLCSCVCVMCACVGGMCVCVCVNSDTVRICNHSQKVLPA